MSAPNETREIRALLARSTRFFGRLQSFDLECPHCGTVYQIRMSAQHPPQWDPWTARFVCTTRDCERLYLLGILAWPIGASPKVASAPPRDQVPLPRQLAQMRREGGGWWLPDGARIRRPHPDTTNLTTEEERPDDHDDD